MNGGAATLDGGVTRRSGWTLAAVSPFLWSIFTPTTTGVESGQAVASVTSSEGDYTYAQGTANNRPLLDLTSGKYSLAFDGSNDQMIAPTTSPQLNLTEFWVVVGVVPTAVAAGDHVVIEFRGAGVGLPIIEIFATGSGGGWSARSWPSSGGGGLVTVSDADQDETLPAIVEFGVVDGVMELWVNGELVDSDTAPVGAYAPARVSIGAQAGAAGPWNGKLYGVVGYVGDRDHRVGEYIASLMPTSPLPAEFDALGDATLVLGASGFYTDTAATTPATPGQLVAAWKDERDGGTLTLIQATSGTRPTYATDGPGGLRFTGGKSLSALFGAALEQPYTVLVAMATATDTPADSTFVWDTPAAAGSGARAMGYIVGKKMQHFAGTLGFCGDLHPVGTGHRIFGCTFDGADSTTWQNGKIAGHGSPGANDFGGLIVGAEQSGGGTAFNGYITGVMVYPFALTAAEHLEAAAYLRDLVGVGVEPHTYTAEQQTVAGQACQILTPTTDPTDLAIYCHGYGESGGIGLTAGADKTGRYAYGLLQAGYVVAMSDQSGLNWGNQDGQDDADALRDFILDRFTPTKTVVFGQSHGGIPGLNLLLDSGWCDGWGGIAPTANLLACFDGTGTTDFDVLFNADIKTAYGIAVDGSDYGTKTDGFDPCARAATDYAGKMLWMVASPSDAAVLSTTNTGVLVALAAGQATEINAHAATGAHGSASHFTDTLVADFVDFCGRC